MIVLAEAVRNGSEGKRYESCDGGGGKTDVKSIDGGGVSSLICV